MAAYKERSTYDAKGNILTYLRNGSTTQTEMDNFVYNYIPGTNQLDHVDDDPLFSGNYPLSGSDIIDIDDQDAVNYKYDRSGNLTKDAAENLKIYWTVYGKVDSIFNTVSLQKIRFLYDPSGNRIGKRVRLGTDITTTWYGRDAQVEQFLTFAFRERLEVSIPAFIAGRNQLASYKEEDETTLRLMEQNLYGSSRLGIADRNQQVYPRALNQNPIDFAIARKQYELTNHLGNVLVTIADVKGPVDENNDGTTDYFKAIVKTQQDYYPFGMEMPERNYASSFANYRFGFNGQERTDEISGAGNHNTALYWEYDTRLGRRWNIDPVIVPSESGYLTFAGNPIWFSDPLGNSASTDVTKNDDGSYTVVGGRVDGDRNIYVVNEEGKQTGEVIGKSLTEYSFLTEAGTAVTGAVIRPDDRTGVNFMNNEILAPDLTLTEYMPEATGGQPLDFKARGIGNRPTGMTAEQFRYRGLSFEGVTGFGNQDGATRTIASARDIGNVAAGYVAGSNGLTWEADRRGFDALESWQQKSFSSEGQPTQRAQRVGFDVGRTQFTTRRKEFLDNSKELLDQEQRERNLSPKF